MTAVGVTQVVLAEKRVDEGFVKKNRHRFLHGRKQRCGGSLFIEILGALVIAILVLIPLITSFSTGIRQTQATKSHLSAQAVGTWAISFGKTLVSEGMPEAGEVDLTQMAYEFVKEPAEQLAYLEVRMKMEPVGSSGRCFSIGVNVSWKDPKIKKRRFRTFQSITRSEV